MTKNSGAVSSRRDFLAWTALAGAGLATASDLDAAAAAGATPPPISGKQALDVLLQGNHRFAGGHVPHLDRTVERRRDVARGQHPFAIILSCSDSRVPPELVFDQGLGELFVIRTAGNLADDIGLGSIEYAVHHWHCPILMVLGHSRCGAVSAAVEGGKREGFVQSIVQMIEPAVKSSAHLPGDKVQNAVAANARLVLNTLRTRSKAIHTADTSGKMRMVAAEYNLDTGIVTVL